MIYGNKWLSLAESTKEEVKDEYNIESLVYDEYLNRKSLLEACTDEAAKPILEAQVEVLREVSIKDIIDKIKEAISKFLKWLKDLVMKIVNKVNEIINNAKVKKIEKLLGDIVGKKVKLKKATVSTKESAIFTEDGSKESNNMPVNAYPDIYFTVDGEKCSIVTFYMNTILEVKKFEPKSDIKINDYLIGKTSLGDEPIYDPVNVPKTIDKYKKVKFFIEPKTEFEDPEDDNVREAAKEYADTISTFKDHLKIMNNDYNRYYKNEEVISDRVLKETNRAKEYYNNNKDYNVNIYNEYLRQFLKLGKEIGAYYYYINSFVTDSYYKVLKKSNAFINWCVDNGEDKAVKTYNLHLNRDNYD